MAYTKYSLTPADNNAAPPNGAPEGMLPSAVNDTMRDMMSQIRDVGDGIRGGTYTMTAPVITGGSVTGVTAVSTSGNLTFTGTGNRILGDFSSAPISNRVAFQNSTTNGQTVVGVIPNGTSTSTQLHLFSSPDYTNYSRLAIQNTGTAITFLSDFAGAGSYLPVTFNTGGSERLRIDTSGNVGIGTTTPTTTLTIDVKSNTYDYGIDISNSNDWGYGSSINFRTIPLSGGSLATVAQIKQYYQTSNRYGLVFSKYDGSLTEAMRIDSSGNVGIGTSSPATKLHFAGTTKIGVTGTNGELQLARTSDGATITTFQTDGTSGIINSAVSTTFQINTAEKMRIDSSGNLLVGTTDAGSTTGVGTKQIANATVPYFINVINDSIGSNYYLLYNTNATNNGYRFYVQANGGVANFAGNNTNLSDQRTKENIELSSSYLDKICAIPVKTFNYKDEPAGEQKTLGVIAQDVEAVAPEFVNNAGFGETKEGETPLKSVYTTDLMFALMKSIQELKTELDSVKAELQTLKGN